MTLENGPASLFTEKWNKEIHILAEEQKFELEGTYMEMSGSHKTFHVPVGGNGTANIGRDRHQDLTISQHDSDAVDISPQFVYVMYALDDIDQFKTETAYREYLHRRAVGDVRRAQKDLLITALASSTNSETTLPSANTLNYNGAIKMAEVLNGASVMADNRFGLISEAAWSDILVDTTVVNNYNYKNDAVASGRLVNIAGFDLRYTNRLPLGAGGAGEHRCYFWQKSCVYGATNRPFQVKVNYDPRKDSWLYFASISVDWEIVDQSGVQYCDITD